MNSSPDRGSFQRECLIERAATGDTSQEHVDEMLDFYKTMDQLQAERESQPEWKVNNLEYDLRSAKWICDKAKAREEYAQNIYAALCNQDWQKNEVWPLLKGQTYSCSWRYAGGIVADMVEKGDYIDWYCSGIQGGADDAELAAMSEEDRNRYMWYQEHFVGEGHVTDEVRQDFFKLGWIPVDYNDDEQIT